MTAGSFGVLTFFLLSDYIVPASLERKGSVRAFWTSRGFRLYPLWILALGAVFLFPVLGLSEPVPFAGDWKALVGRT